MHTLNEIGLRHGTDKSSKGHGYLDFYQQFFGGLRDKPIRLLEIGVFQGNSVAMWQDYFVNGTIIGADINPESDQYATDRIQIEIADQSNVSDLIRLGIKHGPFDVIIDDGSHYWNHQITSLQYLYPFLKPEGFYVIEDIDTSFGSYVTDHRRNATTSAFRYLQKLSEYVTAGPLLDSAAEEDPFIRTFASRTEYIVFHQGTALLRSQVTFDKRDLHSPSPLILPNPNDLTDSVGALTVHLGLHGDVTNHKALIGGARGSKSYTIQGFSVQPGCRLAVDLQYKVLLSDGNWTDWIPAGNFAGTRGQGTSVRGFAARLAGQSTGTLECVCAATFVGEDEIVQTRDGEECVGVTASDLEAMQILLRPRI